MLVTIYFFDSRISEIKTQFLYYQFFSHSKNIPKNYLQEEYPPYVYNGAREKFVPFIYHSFVPSRSSRCSPVSYLSNTNRESCPRGKGKCARIGKMGSAKNSPWRGNIIKDKLLRRIEPLLSYCQSRNNRELRIHGDIDVIFSPRCAVASVTGLIRDVQEIFLIKVGLPTFDLFIPTFHLIPLLISIRSGKLFVLKIYTASIPFFFFCHVDFLLKKRLSQLILDDDHDLIIRSFHDIFFTLTIKLANIFESFLAIHTRKARFIPIIQANRTRRNSHSHKHGTRLNSKRPKAASYVRFREDESRSRYSKSSPLGC